MTTIDDVPAIPLWLAGHAYLTLAPQFADVREAHSGRLLRRTPSCGENEVRLALAAARQALPAWGEVAVVERAERLAQLGDALEGYASHFARLVEEESGCDGASAAAEVCDAVAMLRATPAAADAGAALAAPPPTCAADVLAIFGSARAPLTALLRLAVPAWRGGAALLVVPAAQLPSPVFALAELSARCAFPAGVFNVLYGDATVIGRLLAGHAQSQHA